MIRAAWVALVLAGGVGCMDRETAAPPPPKAPANAAAPAVPAAPAPEAKAATPAPEAGAKGLLLASGSPPQATVSVDGVAKGKAGEVLELSPGKHLVEVSAPGFATYRRPVEVAAGNSASIHFDLTAIPK